MGKTSVSIFRQKKFWLPFLSATLVMLIGLMIFIVPSPYLSSQLYETTAGQFRQVDVTPDVTVEMDANSAMTVANSVPPSVELIRGNVYFNGDGNAVDTIKLEVIMGQAYFQDNGASYSLETTKDGGSIAVSQGQLEMRIGDQTRLVSAGQRVDFDGFKVVGESSIVGLDIASWRL